ncbi:CD63 antigen [Denticeps clupeoides]|uniref:Tetraspanin n=1 Tax=Denticeps clupeoides TaxID=299321 RepID=A0AAY4DAR8_9TELE|nr:CD63 antigen [Denticeps clupeoides]
MAVEGGMKCVKFLLFFFNFIFWICGLALIVLGVVVQLKAHSTLLIINASGSEIPLVLIGVGVIIFFIAFFGCCGAWKENQCMVTMFAILLSLIIITEIGTAIAGYVLRGQLKEVVDKGLKDLISDYNKTEAVKKAVDDIQRDLHCCGVNSPADWANFTTSGNSVPDSCCINITVGCGSQSMHNATKVNQQGCETAVESFLKKNIQWVAVAALVMAFVQILGIVFACMLSRSIRSGYEVM